MEFQFDEVLGKQFNYVLSKMENKPTIEIGAITKEIKTLKQSISFLKSKIKNSSNQSYGKLNSLSLHLDYYKLFSNIYANNTNFATSRSKIWMEHMKKQNNNFEKYMKKIEKNISQLNCDNEKFQKYKNQTLQKMKNTDNESKFSHHIEMEKLKLARFRKRIALKFPDSSSESDSQDAKEDHNIWRQNLKDEKKLTNYLLKNHNEAFKIYRNSDTISYEMGSILKNLKSLNNDFPAN